MENLYLQIHGISASIVKSKPLTDNNYFEKNKDKYKLHEHGYNTPLYEDRLKVPYVPNSLDCFVLRYAYHNFSRWNHRLLLYLKIR